MSKKCPFPNCSFPECYNKSIGKYDDCPIETKIGVTSPCMVKHVFGDRIERVQSGIYALVKVITTEVSTIVHSTNIVVISDFTKAVPYTVYQIVTNRVVSSFDTTTEGELESTSLHYINIGDLLEQYGDFTIKNCFVDIKQLAMIGDKTGGAV